MLGPSLRRPLPLSLPWKHRQERYDYGEGVHGLQPRQRHFAPSRRVCKVPRTHHDLGHRKKEHRGMRARRRSASPAVDMRMVLRRGQPVHEDDDGQRLAFARPGAGRELHTVARQQPRALNGCSGHFAPLGRHRGVEPARRLLHQLIDPNRAVSTDHLQGEQAPVESDIQIEDSSPSLDPVASLRARRSASGSRDPIPTNRSTTLSGDEIANARQTQQPLKAEASRRLASDPGFQEMWMWRIEATSDSIGHFAIIVRMARSWWRWPSGRSAPMPSGIGGSGDRGPNP